MTDRKTARLAKQYGLLTVAQPAPYGHTGSVYQHRKYLAETRNSNQSSESGQRAKREGDGRSGHQQHRHQHRQQHVRGHVHAEHRRHVPPDTGRCGEQQRRTPTQPGDGAPHRRVGQRVGRVAKGQMHRIREASRRSEHHVSRFIGMVGERHGGPNLACERYAEDSPVEYHHCCSKRLYNEDARCRRDTKYAIIARL